MTRRILFVAMQSSPHTARWVASVADAGWDLHMFGIDDHPPNPLLRGVTLHWPQPPLPKAAPPILAEIPVVVTGVARIRRFLRYARTNPGAAFEVLLRKLRLAPGPAAAPEGAAGGAKPDAAAGAEPPPPEEEAAPEAPRIEIRAYHPAPELFGEDHEGRIPFGATGASCPARHGPAVLAELIRELKPDLIHSMEFQHAGYLVLAARDILGAEGFPPWLATNWGSDIYLFGRDPKHEPEIRRLLAAADFYSCECHRDVELARDFGFGGRVLPVLPNSGGMDLSVAAPLRSPDPPSRRRQIMVKGYDHFAGRGMVALDVVERFAGRLRGHEVVLFSVGPRPRKRALRLRAEGKLNIRVIDWAPHEGILAEFGRARLYLGISVSDAISTASLEAMAMGAFPIQTNTSCCTEWFEDGVGGIAIPPDDFEAICAAFERALTDDALVDRAAELNRRIVEERLDAEVVRPKVHAFYDEAFAALPEPARGAA